jgi:DNA-binding GntR family transcriptional regulator
MQRDPNEISSHKLIKQGKAGSDMPQSAAEKVRLKLEQDILSFIIKPGEKLDETRLAESHGVSRTPVREALRQLHASGLVEMRPYRGAVARRLSIVEIVEMFEMMAILEGICARLAAKRAMIEHLQKIRSAHEKCYECANAGDLDDYYNANESFHELIYGACGNSAIVRQTMQLRDRLKPFRRYQLNQVNRLQQSFIEHGRILAAIESGSAEEADKAMQDHLGVQSAFIANLVSQMPRSFIHGEEATAHPAGRHSKNGAASLKAAENGLSYGK